MKLKKALPPGRSLEQVKNHYLVEKSLARRLMAASREQRKAIYGTMYDELFSKVPDHPRLRRRESRELTAKANMQKLALVSSFLEVDSVFLEFAPGDCQFAIQVAQQVGRVIGVDISDQRIADLECPKNFELVIYDGYSLDAIKDISIDVLFSDQLIEHFHPEDVELHFSLAYGILKPGGKYVLRTPHVSTGPHDVSQFFSDEPEGFHLKEWTYIELRELLMHIGYAKVDCYWLGKGKTVLLPFRYFSAVEKILRHLPKARARSIARYLIPEIFMVAQK